MVFFFELQQKLFNDYDKVKEEFKDYLFNENIKVLDIGCSTGTAASYLFDFTKGNYTGIDISDKYIQLARKNYSKDSFVKMDATQMDFEDESFDIVLFNGVLHHMSDELIRNCLKEVQRVLKNNGKVLVGEPVFTKSMPISTFFLNHDRGKFIRESDGYKDLISSFKIERERYFRFFFT